MTFLELQDKILSYIHRPASEMRTIVKFEINVVRLQIQRLHAFKYAERLVDVTYPANAQSIKLTGACEGTPRNLITVQLLGNSTQTSGQVMKISTFNSIMQRRLRYEKMKAYSCEQPTISHTDFISQSHGHEVFLINDAIGLYPIPTEDKSLLVNLNIWLPVLVDDASEDFLTTYAYDYIVDRTLSRLSFYLKDDARSDEIDKKVAADVDALIQWDSQIRTVTENE